MAVKDLLEEIQTLCKDPSENAYLGRCQWDNGKVYDNWQACRDRLSDIEVKIENALWELEYGEID